MSWWNFARDPEEEETVYKCKCGHKKYRVIESKSHREKASDGTLFNVITEDRLCNKCDRVSVVETTTRVRS